MNLYLVQDADRPMYVVADGWQAALDRALRRQADRRRIGR